MCTWFSASWRRFRYDRKCLFSCIYNSQVTISPTSLFSANFNGNRVKNHPKPWTCPLKNTLSSKRFLFVCFVLNGQLSCGSPRLVALGISGALPKLKSAANDLPYTSQVTLGLFGQCNAQASKVAYCFCQSVMGWYSIHNMVRVYPQQSS